MQKINFNSNWLVSEGIVNPFGAVFGVDPLANAKKVTLPDDQMINGKPDKNESNGTASGFLPSKTYTYTKIFKPSDDWKNKQVLVEFEGVMNKAKVYLNDNLIATNNYGYNQFYTDLVPYLKFNQDNKLQIVAINNSKNSRWYTGAGIYRNVNLYIGGNLSIVPEKTRISTPDVDPKLAMTTIDTAINNMGRNSETITVKIDIYNKAKKVASEDHILTVRAQEETKNRFRFNIANPDLWSISSPNLYTAKIQLISSSNEIIDSTTLTFGIRKLRLDSINGLRINDTPVKLRGACIHHDNGIIGARTYQEAEYYRCKKLKDAGFNAIRSSHGPMSKEMLKACDELGMLVMDELSDIWNTAKNENDFSFEFNTNWKKQAKKMVAKDYNHPSVIMYSLGNEIPEIGREEGRHQLHQLNTEFHKLDPTRYTTLAINGMIALVDLDSDAIKSVGDAFKAAFMHADKQLSENHGNIDELNSVMGDITDENRDALNISAAEDTQLAEVEDDVDIIGYNYMPARYEHHHQTHPNHVMIGSESYAREIPRLWDQVTKHPYVLGDFTWTGYDYIGEAGIGVYHYNDRSDMGIFPDRLAYCGDIDLTGYRRPVSYLREIVYGLRKKPYIAAARVDKFKQPVVLNHWKYDDLVHSWTFPGFENEPTQVSILSSSPIVELFLNGKSLGKKEAGKKNDYTATYNLKYEPGTLKAISYDENDNKVGEDDLQTASSSTNFKVEANKQVLDANGQDLLILEISLIDQNNLFNMWDKKDIKVTVDGPGELIGLGSADPQTQLSYQADTFPTYDGRLQAVIRTKKEAGTIKVTISSDDLEEKVLSFIVK